MRDRERNNYILLAFFVFILITRIYYFNCFYVPNSDFFDMRATAISAINLELPEYYQRLPLYSYLMGLLSLVLPGKQPILFAAEIINLVAFIISCLFLYLISKRFLGKAALIVVYVFAMHPLTVQLTIQPIAQMLTTMFVLIGIYLACDAKASSYFFSFFASLSRYEGFLLIPSMLIKDFIFSKRKIFFIVLGLLSSIGLIVWTILNYHSTGHINPYYRYFSPDLKPAGLKFLQITIRSLYNIIDPRFIYFIPHKVNAVIILSLTTIGFYYLLKNSFKETLPILTFFLSCLFINFIFFSPAEQHIFIFLWILILSIASGLKLVINFIGQKFQKMQSQSTLIQNHKIIMILYIILIFLCPVLLLLNVDHAKTTTELIIFSLMSYAILIWFMLSNFRPNTYMNTIIMLSLIFFISFFSVGNVMSIQKKIERMKYSKSELRLIGEWFSKNVKGEKKIIVSEPWVAGYYSDPSRRKNFLYLGSLKANSHESLIAELKEKKITYVAWNSTHGLKKNDAGHSFYYNIYKMFLISNLKEGQDVDHFKLIKKFDVGLNYAYIYEFIP